MSAGISYSPESMTYTLFDGTNSLKLPNWAHKVIVEECEREVRPLNSKIEILSDALALARQENAKLREERDMYRDLVGMMDHPDLNAQLQAENTKLRELMPRMAKALGVGSGWCTRDCGAEFLCDKGYCPIETALHELEIEILDD